MTFGRRDAGRVPGNANRSSGRVLLAEDDGEMRLLLSAVLRKDGYEVVEAQDGMEVRSLLSAGPMSRYDVVISDIRMPCVDGLDVLFGLRQSDRKTPVILMTAFGDPDTLDEASRLGATAVLNKPFDVNDLRRIVSSVVASCRLLI